MQRFLAAHRILRVPAILAAALLPLALAAPSRGDLNSRANALQHGISAESGVIAGYQGRLSDLHARLDGLEASLRIQRSILLGIQTQLLHAQTRLVELRADLVRDRRTLSAQLVSEYESPQPDVTGVVLEARGFNDLLNRLTEVRRIARNNARVVAVVQRDRSAVARQATRLAVARTRQQRVTAAVLVERDQVESIQLTLLRREQATAGDRARKQAELRAIQRRLNALAARAAAAQNASFSALAPTGGTCPSSAGFFPAPGTDYSVGQEPTIAARLDRMGKALCLHLIGISGYRSPQHSVEVGGFANDPHTRGAASDTPGVEGVPESTLLRFGLTRPFPGPAEADHIQLA